jgi:transcriptional regulator with XRE-family HTH domain
MAPDDSGSPATAVGAFIREQRQLAQLSLREMARLTSVSNAYLSQVERGLHEPSLRVLRAVADALGVPLEQLVGRGAPARADDTAPDESEAVERSIRQHPRLSSAQKEALLGVFRGFLAED